MTEQKQNPLCKLIKEIKDGINPISNEFEVIPLSSEKINYEGSMIFSKEAYTEDERNKFKNGDKFKEYPYKHRYYALYKKPEGNNSTLTFILYNPSYANPEEIDDTIKNCITLAQGYGNIEILNLFSLRQTESSQKDLKKYNSINSQFLDDYLNSINNDIVAAWGCGKDNKHKKYCNKIYDYLKNKNAFFIGIDTEQLDQQINRHPDKRVWNGLGDFKNIAKLVPIDKI